MNEEGSDLLATAAWSAPSESSPEAPLPVTRTTMGSDIGRPPVPRGRHRPPQNEPTVPPGARFASPMTTVLPAPAPAHDAPSAVPQAVSPAGTWADFEPTSRPSIDDTSFYRPLPAVAPPKTELPRRSENDLFSAPIQHRRPGKPLLAVITALVIAGAAAGGFALTRGSDNPGTTAKPIASASEISASATGTAPVPIHVPTDATSGTPYSLDLPPKWSATGRLTGPATQHIDLTLTNTALGIEATISSLVADSAPNPKNSVPITATAVTTLTTTFAGESAKGARWTLDGLRHEEFTLVHNGTAYTLTARALASNTSQFTEDLKSLRRSWKFTP